MLSDGDTGATEGAGLCVSDTDDLTAHRIATRQPTGVTCVCRKLLPPAELRLGQTKSIAQNGPRPLSSSSHEDRELDQSSPVVTPYVNREPPPPTPLKRDDC